MARGRSPSRVSRSPWQEPCRTQAPSCAHYPPHPRRSPGRSPHSGRPQGLTVEQILPVDLAAGAAPEEETSDPLEQVPIVSPSAAIDDAQIAKAAVIETVPVVGSRLKENRAKPAPRRTQWERFVAVRVDAQQAAAMAPVLAVGALAVIDRHYNSLAPYRANQPNIYAVRSGSMLMLRYVDFDERHLILRPFLREFPVQLIGLREGESPADYIVGRVCLVVAEV